SRFLTKYSTPETTVVTSMTQTHTVSHRGGTSNIIIIMHIMVANVLILPDMAAAMTRPFSTAMSRRPVTANSRASTIISAQDGIRPHSTKISIAAVTSSLSASGSTNLPKLET